MSVVLLEQKTCTSNFLEGIGCLVGTRATAQGNMDFILRAVGRASDLKSIKSVTTRFPPEPNGHLHLGHLKSLWLNWDVASCYGGICQLRFDDTNPKTEKESFVGSAIKTLGWLGYHALAAGFASDYYSWFNWCTTALTHRTLFYVNQQSFELCESIGGSPKTQANDGSVVRLSSSNHNVRLFRQMRFGRFKSGAVVVRTRLSPQASSTNLKDPALLRIVYASHYRTRCCWNIYPTYDFAHCTSDYAEGITHSLCSLEFANNQPLYCWVVGVLLREQTNLRTVWPRQLEFARLTLQGVQASKRRILKLARQRFIGGWDDLRLCSITSLRRTGFTRNGIEASSLTNGTTRSQSALTLSSICFFGRKHLGEHLPKRMITVSSIWLLLENRWTNSNNNNQLAIAAEHLSWERRKQPTAGTAEITAKVASPGITAIRLSYGSPMQREQNEAIRFVGVGRGLKGELVWRGVVVRQPGPNAPTWNTIEGQQVISRCKSVSSSLGSVFLGGKTAERLMVASVSVNSWTSKGSRGITGRLGCFVVDSKQRCVITTKLNFGVRV